MCIEVFRQRNLCAEAKDSRSGLWNKSGDAAPLKNGDGIIAVSARVPIIAQKTAQIFTDFRHS
jgi:hypothetical protein